MGSFPGQAAETAEATAVQRANIVPGPAKPDPLVGFLAQWASLADLKTSAPIDLQQLVADSGRLVFLINWETQPADVQLTIPLDKPAHQVREIITDQPLATAGAPLQIQVTVPSEDVRVFRIDY